MSVQENKSEPAAVADDALANGPELEDLELDLLLEGIARRYGSDFRGYARSSLKRRVLGRVRAEGLHSVSGFQERVLHDAPTMGRLLHALTCSDVGMFRDPAFYLTFRLRIVPVLRTYPFVRIWHAGCSSGEEVYAMAILLAEEGLSARVRLYATDVAESALAQAKAGVYSAELFPAWEARYRRAGGRTSLADWVTIGHDGMALRPSLRDNVVFGQHDLATDRSFNEFNVVLCRNVMMRYSHDLGRRVHRLLHESLCRLGILALGAPESLRGSGYEERYDTLDADARLYRRVG
jgi:chemotaxis protein methyltransferase CheR